MTRRDVSRHVSRPNTRRPIPTPRPAAITWQNAICEATATGWHFQMPVVASANRIWRRGKTRTYKAENAGADVRAAAVRFGRVSPILEDVAVRIVWVRERRAGDVDNRVKATLDTLKGIAFRDDDQVARIEVERVDDLTTPAGLYVWVEPITAARVAA